MVPELLASKLQYACVPPQIQSMVLPVFVKPTTPPSVRLAAFLMTMKTNPSAGVLQFITHGLKKETSMEVVSFVYTYLETLSHSQNPKFYNM